MSMATQSASLMTAEQLLQLHGGSVRYELVKGELRTMPPAGSEHGATGMKFSWRLAQFVESHNLGLAFLAETGFKISSDPDTVRAPDLAFVRSARVPKGDLPRGYFPGPPDLAVEVVSPGDTVEEVEDKIAEWLEAGTVEVWVVNPRRRSVAVHRNGEDVRVLRAGEVIDGGALLPGFTLEVALIFS